MSYKVFSYQASSNFNICMDYSKGQAAVLSAYGSYMCKATREPWMDQDNVHVVVVYNDNGQLVGGMRLHIADGVTALPMETRVLGVENIITGIKGNDTSAAEICGLWIGKEQKNKGIEQILSVAATAVARRFGVNSLYVHTDPKHYDMFTQLGYVKAEGVGRNGTTMSAYVDYSILMVIPDLQTLEYTSDAQKGMLLSLTDTPKQAFVSTLDGIMFISYELVEELKGVVVSCREAVPA